METKTEKIKIKVNVAPKYKEIEVSFPYYVKDDGLYCKFLSRSAAMWISEFSFKKQVEYSDYGVPEIWLTNDPITEEEFNAKFNEVINALKERNNEIDCKAI